MSASDWIGLLIGIGTLAVVIGGGLIAHMISDAREQGGMQADIKNLKDQVGTSETGLVGSLHRHKNQLGRLEALMLFFKDKLGIKTKWDEEE